MLSIRVGVHTLPGAADAAQHSTWKLAQHQSGARIGRAGGVDAALVDAHIALWALDVAVGAVLGIAVGVHAGPAAATTVTPIREEAILDPDRTRGGEARVMAEITLSAGDPALPAVVEVLGHVGPSTIAAPDEVVGAIGLSRDTRRDRATGARARR